MAETAFGFARNLSEGLGPRESATEQELAAAEYLASQLEGFGYPVELQPFSIEVLSSELSGLTLEGQETGALEVIPLVLSATGEASGELLDIGLGREGEIVEGGLAGKIAFAERGLIRFEEKVTRAAAAGARGVVIYNNLPGNFRGVLRNQGSVPVVAISQRDGQMIKELLLAGPVRGSVSVGAEVHTSRNVVAEKLGQGDDVLVLGGHYDTVPDVPGANDNASGVAVLLTIAEELSQVSLPFTVRFIAFGSEELGLKGSLHYVASLDGAQRSRIRAMFNFDGVGSGRQLGILGDTGLTQFAVDLGAGENIDVRISAGLSGGGSDHMSFSRVGIPIIMFFSDDFSRLHTPRDTLEFVAPSLLGDAAGLAIALLKSKDFLLKTS